MTYQPGEYHPAFEEYCETIYELAEDRPSVIQARIADRLRVSRPAVSEMMRRLVAEGFVAIADDVVVLTADGTELAERVVRRHRLAERFLTDVLDLPWGTAHHEAGKWEHVMSDRVEEAMERVLGRPTTCPHGNPIPGSGFVAAPGTIALAAAAEGTRVRIERITEELEFVDGLLDFLQTQGVRPGVGSTVVSRAPDGTTTLAVERFDDTTAVGLSSHACERILVTVEG